MAFNPNAAYGTFFDAEGALYISQGGAYYDRQGDQFTLATLPKTKSGFNPPSPTGFDPSSPVLFANGSAVNPSIAFASAQTIGMFLDSGNLGIGYSVSGIQIAVAQGGGNPGLTVNGSYAFQWGNGVGSLISPDLKLTRDAANTLAQRNGVNAQTSNLYGTYTDASNYERAFMSFGKIGASLVIGHEFAGTGTGRDVYLQASSRVIFQSNGANNRWMVDGSGHFAALADNAFDMGSSSGRARNVYAGGAIQLGAAALTAPAGSVSLGATTTTTVGAAGAASALPTAPTGYLVINVGGTTQRIPYYN